MADTAHVKPPVPAPPQAAPPPVPPPLDSAPRPPAPAEPNQASRPSRVFASDRPTADGAAEPTPALDRLAELIVHRNAETPFTLAIVGGPGTGKTRALSQVARWAASLSRGAEGKASPYLPGLVTVAASAVDLAADPVRAVAERLHRVLTRTAPDVAGEAAEEANYGSGDPHAHLRAVGERLDAARRRLDAERNNRDEAESRRARLTETLLYDSGGSRVDAYARANRASIETALTSFGLGKGDTLATYKGLVHTLADSGGPARRVVFCLKSLWAYRGQTKLLVWAVLFFVAAWLFGLMRQNPSWLDPLTSGGETLRNLGEGVRARIGLLGVARQLSLLAGFLCLAACLWRAIRFSRPLLRGASLIDADVAVRRVELDNLVAHHAQRVEALTGETEALSRRVTEAERRAAGAEPVVASPVFLGEGGVDEAPRVYLFALDQRLGRDGAKRRALVLLDDLDRLAPEAALDVLEKTSTALAGRSFVLAASFDADRIAGALGESGARRLERLVQASYRVGLAPAPDWRAFVSRVCAPRAPAAPRTPDLSRSALDMPLDEKEQKLLAGLAPLAGPSPRRVKRFINLYRLGRHDAAGDLAGFAFALALSIGGAPNEVAAVRGAVATGEASQSLRRDAFGPRVQAALDLVTSLQGHGVSFAEARRAQALAAQWTLVEAR